MVTLKAIRPCFGDYTGGRSSGPYKGLIHPGEIFQAKEEDAEQLEAAGLAERVRTYVRQPFASRNIEDFKATFPAENKMLKPQPNKAKSA